MRHVFWEGQMILRILPRTLLSSFEFYLVKVKKISSYFCGLSEDLSTYEIYQGKKYYMQIQTLNMKFPLVFTFKSFSKERKKGKYALIAKQGGILWLRGHNCAFFLNTYLPVRGHFEPGTWTKIYILGPSTHLSLSTESMNVPSILIIIEGCSMLK